MRMSYQDWEELSANEMEEKMVRYRRANRRMAKYYKRQRTMGLLFMVIGLIAVGIGYPMTWKLLYILGTIITLTGLYCMFTKRMVYIDKYYLECQDRMRDLI